MNEQKPEELKEGSYIAEPVMETRYYERALELQAQRIARQKEMLARLNSVYNRDVENAKISEVLKFLIKIIIKRIKK